MAKWNVSDVQAEIQRRISLMSPADQARVDYAKLNTVDIKSIIDSMQAKWTWDIWDKVSPINDASAALILERNPNITADTEVFLVLRDGKVIFFQPQMPNDNTKLTKANVRTFALEFRDNYVNDAIINQIFEIIMMPETGVDL